MTKVACIERGIQNLHLAVYPPNGRIRVATPKQLDDDIKREDHIESVYTDYQYAVNRTIGLVVEAKKKEPDFGSNAQLSVIQTGTETH